MNYAKQIAEMLGLEIGEKFQIEGHTDLGTFWFVEDNINIWDSVGCGGEYYAYDSDNDILEQLLIGKLKIKKIPWKPEFNYYYFYIFWCLNDPHIDHCRWTNTISDFTGFKAGNCFRTRDEAEASMIELCEKLKKGYENG